MVVEVTVGWSGGRIGSGVTVLHMGGEDVVAPDTVLTAVRSWLNAIRGNFPDDVTLTVNPEIKVLNSVTGALEDIVIGAPGAPVTGSFTGTWANGSGRLVNLGTGFIAGGRRIKGRIFLVPSANFTDATGNVLAGTLTADLAAHSTLLGALSGAASPLVVWSKVSGIVAPVNLMTTNPRPVSLRTRNDRT